MSRIQHIDNLNKIHWEEIVPVTKNEYKIVIIYVSKTRQNLGQFIRMLNVLSRIKKNLFLNEKCIFMYN